MQVSNLAGIKLITLFNIVFRIRKFKRGKSYFLGEGGIVQSALKRISRSNNTNDKMKRSFCL